MKWISKKIQKVILILPLLTVAFNLFSQTSGTLIFSTSTTSTSGYSPSHLLAIWIEKTDGSFIKTKIRYCSIDNLDHLQAWVIKSNQNTADAITGSTLTSHGSVGFQWNGTDASGLLVPDGTYNIILEMAWGSSLSTGKTIESFQFTKGATSSHYTPQNTTNFLSTSYDWTPLVSGFEKESNKSNIKIFPNPTSGHLNIEFMNHYKMCRFKLIDIIGNVVYNENLTDINIGIKTFDFSDLADGIYIARLSLPDREVVLKVILRRH